jgi:hypothetical protein
MIESRSGAEGLGSFHAKILGSCGEFGIIAGQGNSVSRSMGDLDSIGQTNGNHECLQLMKAVSSLPKDAERKVDLGRSHE